MLNIQESTCYNPSQINILGCMIEINRDRKMQRFSRLLLLVIFILLCNYLYPYNFFSPIIRSEKLNVIPEQLEIQLKEKPLIINSEKVYNDSLTFSDKDYKLDSQKGIITFLNPIGIVIIEYQIVPEDVKEKFYIYQTQVYTDSTEIKKNINKRSLFSNSTNLNISGSKTISVSVANNEDFSLDQSLFLKIDGEMSQNLNIEAQLSDSQSPITPEGDSREISSLDKIFLRLYGRQYDLAFGDLEMEFKDTKFINFSPKFEGLKAAWFDQHEAKGALAISKGKHTTINFAGIDGKQGPYYLSTDNMLGVQAVPGSEDVYLNGSKMQRGDDYTIDYSEGSITFSNAHFISEVSQIQVSFQYSDENYRQNMYLASSKVNLTDKLQLANFMIIQIDDKNNPLQDELTDEDIDDLEAAGDDEVWGSGITAVENGLYIQSSEGFYEFVGNDSTIVGNYNIHFEDIGQNEGDYDYDASGDYYYFVGTGVGSYLPIRELIAPQKLANYDMYAKYETDELLLKTEGLISSYDKNVYSDKDDGDNNGFAANVLANYTPELDKIEPEIELEYQRIGEDLNTFADLSSASQNYEFVQIPDTLASSTYSGKIAFRFFDVYQPELVLKRTSAAGFADQDYLSFTSQILPKTNRTTLFYRYFTIKQKNENNLNQEYNVYQHNFKLTQALSIFKLSSSYLTKTTDWVFSSGTENTLEFKNFDIKLETARIKKLTSDIFFRFNMDKQLIKNDTIPTAISKHVNTYAVGLNAKYNTDQHRINLAISRQIIDNLKMEKRNDFNLASISTSNNFFERAVNLNTNYSIKNVEFNPKVKEFIFVGEGLGSYEVVGSDTLEVGFGEGDYDWKIISIDYDIKKMSVELNAGTTLNLSPKMITENYFSRFKSETFLQVTENSTETENTDLYLLDPDILMQEETTLFGRNIVQQTVWYDIIKKKLSAKARYKEENTLDNRYNNESDSTEIVAKEIQLKLNSIKNIGFEFYFETEREKESQYHSIVEAESYTLDVRNRINIDLNLKTSFSITSEDGKRNDNTNRYKIDAFKIEETVTYFMKRKYRLFAKLDFIRNNRGGSDYLGFLADKKDGNIFKWKLNLDYKVNSYTSAGLIYSGSSYPDEKDEHKLSVEVKAEF
jgi:hypothetical protein